MKIAVVTGASRGIGFATADVLLRAGYHTAFFSQNPGSLQAAADLLSKDHSPERIFHQPVDLRDTTSINAFFDAVGKRWEHPSVLVCNAGISPKSSSGERKPFTDIGLDEWQEVLRVNLTSAALCCQRVVGEMAAHGFGRIILVGSIATRAMPSIAGAAYTASKSGLAGLARALVSEYSKFGVTTNVVAPGLILTEMAGDPDAPKNRLALQRIPVGRFGKPEDIARVIQFLAGDEGDFINGAVIDVNGGEYMAP